MGAAQAVGEAGAWRKLGCATYEAMARDSLPNQTIQNFMDAFSCGECCCSFQREM